MPNVKDYYAELKDQKTINELGIEEPEKLSSEQITKLIKKITAFLILQKNNIIEKSSLLVNTDNIINSYDLKIRACEEILFHLGSEERKAAYDKVLAESKKEEPLIILNSKPVNNFNHRYNKNLFLTSQILLTHYQKNKTIKTLQSDLKTMMINEKETMFTVIKNELALILTKTNELEQQIKTEIENATNELLWKNFQQNKKKEHNNFLQEMLEIVTQNKTEVTTILNIIDQPENLDSLKNFFLENEINGATKKDDGIKKTTMKKLQQHLNNWSNHVRWLEKNTNSSQDSKDAAWLLAKLKTTNFAKKILSADNNKEKKVKESTNIITVSTNEKSSIKNVEVKRETINLNRQSDMIDDFALKFKNEELIKKLGEEITTIEQEITTIEQKITIKKFEEYESQNGKKKIAKLTLQEEITRLEQEKNQKFLNTILRIFSLGCYNRKKKKEIAITNVEKEKSELEAKINTNLSEINFKNGIIIQLEEQNHAITIKWKAKPIIENEINSLPHPITAITKQKMNAIS